MTTLLSVPNATQTGIIKLEGYEYGVRYVIADNICYYAITDAIRLMGVKGTAPSFAAKISPCCKGRHAFGGRPAHVANLDGLIEILSIVGSDSNEALNELIVKVGYDLGTELEVAMMCFIEDIQEDIDTLTILFNEAHILEAQE